MGTIRERPLVGVVGVCGSGKTTVVNGLKPYGIEARHIAQEHSYVPTMWQRITNPYFLIFLDASYPETIKRRRLDWTYEEYLEQHRRLSHARQNCNIYIFTDPLTPEEVIDTILSFLKTQGIENKNKGLD